MSDSKYSVPKLDIGDGEVFWSDGGQQVRVFGPTSSLRGPWRIMEKVAMRILHLVDRHGGYYDESDDKCVKCRMIRAFRQQFGGALVMKQETIDHMVQNPNA